MENHLLHIYSSRPLVAPHRQRTNLSVLESTRLLVSSPYLRSLALLVVCYGLSLNIVDTATVGLDGRQTLETLNPPRGGGWALA